MVYFGDYKVKNSNWQTAKLFSRSKCLTERWSDEGGIHQAPVVQKVDIAINWIHHYPVDSAIGFPNTYPLDSDLSSG